jgi:GTP-binding protein EngB required for normal cell division/uncharacterized protein (DUF697 family)
MTLTLEDFGYLKKILDKRSREEAIVTCVAYGIGSVVIQYGLDCERIQMSIHEDIKRMRGELDKLNETVVNIALFGQPGAGKSSLINMMAGDPTLAVVGIETDKTVEAKSHEFKGLKFVDLPGYGTKRFPKEEFWGKFEINKFDLFLCVTSGKLHQADTEFFQELKKIGKTCIFVANKHDELWQEGVTIDELERRKKDDIGKHVEQPVQVIFTSCKTKKGLDILNTEISKNLDGAKKERWLRSAKAYSQDFLCQKREASEKYIAYASLASAANAINPIPGADIAVDMSILIGLFKTLRDCYGLNDEILNKYSTLPLVAPLANNILKYARKEGILMILKQFAHKQVAKSVLKYVPIWGQGVAAGIGYKITSSAGKSYLDDCHQLAEQTLEKNLKN